MKWLCAVAAALAVVLSGGAADARPFTVDDLLGQESFGAQAIDPSGRWLVFEQRGRYDSAERFDHHFSTGRSLSRLRVFDLKNPADTHPLIAQDPGPGLLIGAFSPSGERLVVYSMRNHQWTFGVVTVATGAVRWFDLTPQEPGRGHVLQWISDRELLAIVRPDRLAPADVREGWFVKQRLAAAWEASARGEAAYTVQGSGVFAAVRDRGPPARMLRIDVMSGAQTELGAGYFTDLELSPDRSRVAVFRAGPDIQPRPDGPARGPFGLETEESRLSVLDLRTRAWRAMAGDIELLPNLMAWSPSGRWLLGFTRGRDHNWTHGQLIRIDSATGAATTVGETIEAQERLNPVVVRAGWMGEDPVLYGHPAAQAHSSDDWYRMGSDGPINLTGALGPDAKQIVALDDQGLVAIENDHLWRADRGGRVSRLDPRPVQIAIRAFRGTEGSRVINSLPRESWVLFAGRERWLGLSDAHKVQFTMPISADSGEPVAASRTGEVAVSRHADSHGVETLLAHRGHAEPSRVAVVNRALADTDVPEVLPVFHRGELGEPLTSWLYLPPRASSGERPPVIVRPYLGYTYPTPPRELYLESGFFQNIRMLVGHGYAVLVPSLPNPPGGMTDPMAHVADRITAVLSAAEHDPRLAARFDAGRAAILGWSFGGYTTMATITQTDRFRAAVEMDGISDLVEYWSDISVHRLIVPESGYGSGWETGTVESTQPELHAPPWRDLDRYLRNSPLLAADKIHTPLLLIHGGQDAIPPVGSVAMYSALFRQGKDAEFVIYWGADHATTSPGDVRDVYRRTFAFLDRYLSDSASRPTE